MFAVKLQRGSSDKAYIFPSWHVYKTLIFKLPKCFLNLVCSGSKIYIESIKIGFKAIHHLQNR